MHHEELTTINRLSIFSMPLKQKRRHYIAAIAKAKALSVDCAENDLLRRYRIGEFLAEAIDFDDNLDTFSMAETKEHSDLWHCDNITLLEAEREEVKQWHAAKLPIEVAIRLCEGSFGPDIRRQLFAGFQTGRQTAEQLVTAIEAKQAELWLARFGPELCQRMVQ